MSFQTYIGDDTPVLVEYDFQPFEKATLTYPGCDAQITLESVIVANDDCVLDDLNLKTIIRIQDEIAEAMSEAQNNE
jgi:hypothetical protein